MVHMFAQRVVSFNCNGFEFAKHETSHFNFGFDFFTADNINTLQKNPNVNTMAIILMDKMNTCNDKVLKSKYKNELKRFNSWEFYMLDNGYTININIL